MLMAVLQNLNTELGEASKTQGQPLAGFFPNEFTGAPPRAGRWVEAGPGRPPPPTIQGSLTWPLINDGLHVRPRSRALRKAL